MKKLILICMIFSMIVLASAQLTFIPEDSTQLTFIPEEPANIKSSCFNENNSFCSAITTCNITILFPNMSLFVDNGVMTYNTQYFNYTTNNLTERGEYNVLIHCVDSNVSGYTSFTFLSTDIPMNEQGVVAIGILFSIIALAFLFLIIGFKLSQSDTLFPIALFFILISIVLGVYSINLGYLYNRDLLISTMTSGSHFNIYFGVVYGLIGMSFLALLVLFVKTIKELRERKSIINYGEHYNPKTKSYK